MSITRTSLFLAMSLALIGCTLESRSTSPARVWSQSLSEEEKVRCQQVAWDAAHSREMAERFKLKRTTTAPMKLETNGIKFYVDGNHGDKVVVAIPDAGHVDFHAHYIGVTISRETFEVLSMSESFWP